MACPVPGCPCSCRAVPPPEYGLAGMECAGVWSTTTSSNGKQGLPHDDGLRLHACLCFVEYLPAHLSTRSLGWSMQYSKASGLIRSGVVRKCRRYPPLSGSRNRENPVAKSLFITIQSIGRLGLLLLIRRCVVCLRLDASHRHGSDPGTGGAGAAHARTRTRPPPLVRRAGSRPGNTGAAFAAVFTCDGQLLSIQSSTATTTKAHLIPPSLPPGRRLAHVLVKADESRGAESDTATPGLADPLRGSSSWFLVGLAAVALFQPHPRAYILSSSVPFCASRLAAAQARYETERVAVSSRRLVLARQIHRGHLSRAARAISISSTGLVNGGVE